ncbi:hypothetical protein R3P38DRAFT_2783528 [Favolaschia claudopus]|uniref:Uncharacterized protein n=1 Tax=Favolaschia claudopus TaxID=2862362 RepID=A0AAW0AZR9_9AGAR
MIALFVWLILPDPIVVEYFQPSVSFPVALSSVPSLQKTRMAREDDPISESDLQRMERDFGREIKKLVNDARGNKLIDSYGFRLVVVAEFDFMAAVAGARQAVPTESYVWMDAVPRVACSADGFGLVVHLPGAIKRASALERMARLAIKRALTTFGPGQIAGLFKLHSTPVPSRDMLKTGTGFVASLDLIAQLRLVSHRVNCVVEEVDPVYYAQLKELHAAASKRYRFYDVLGTKDPLYMEGRELMYNRQTPLHPDKSDPKLGGLCWSSSALSLEVIWLYLV